MAFRCGFVLLGFSGSPFSRVLAGLAAVWIDLSLKAGDAVRQRGLVPAAEGFASTISYVQFFSRFQCTGYGAREKEGYGARSLWASLTRPNFDYTWLDAFLSTHSAGGKYSYMKHPMHHQVTPRRPRL